MIEERLKMKHFFEGEPTTEIEKLAYKLSEKLVKEYNEFIEKLVSLEPEEIIQKSYEKICKEEFVYSFEKQNLSITEYKALLKKDGILQECYDEWMKSDGNFNEMLEYSVERAVENITNDFKENLKQKNKESR